MIRPTLLALLLAAAAPASGQEAGGEETWYAARISTGDTPVAVEHLWAKGDRFRSETVLLGHPIVNIVRGEQYFIIDTLDRTGVAIQRSPVAVQQDAARDRPFANEFQTLVAAGGEAVGTKRVAGRQCELWRITNDEGRREVCVSMEEPRLPLTREVWMRTSGRSAKTDYVEWLRTLEIPDAFFEPPPDLALEHITYEQYLQRAPKERLGPAPPFHRELLHGNQEE